MSESEVAAAAEVVHAHGKRMSAHARSADAVKMCVRHGVKVVYHANFVDEEALDLLEANKDWVFVSPNIGFTAIAAYEGQECISRCSGKRSASFSSFVCPRIRSLRMPRSGSTRTS